MKHKQKQKIQEKKKLKRNFKNKEAEIGELNIKLVNQPEILPKKREMSVENKEVDVFEDSIYPKPEIQEPKVVFEKIPGLFETLSYFYPLIHFKET